MAPKTSIALGFFDGVHLAHQKIIGAAFSYAEKNGLRGAALTFDRAPSEVLFGEPRLSLTDNEEKSEIISAMGGDCILLNTTPELLSMDGESFVRHILLEKMNGAAAFCGYNYTFGSDRLTAEELCSIGQSLGLHVEVLEEQRAGGLPISSSRIRSLLQNGKTEEAAELLGRPYSVTGIVEAGKRLGRTMGFPTINIYPRSDRSFIPRGVYASWAVFGGERHIGVTNIGVNPTVGDKNIRIETYLPDFSGNLYGCRVRIEFVHFVRPERKFDSVDELFRRIALDAESVKKLMGQKTV